VPGVPGVRVTDFQGGHALDGSPATGAHVVYGAIFAEYKSLGYPISPLGLPTSDEQGIPGSRDLPDLIRRENGQKPAHNGYRPSDTCLSDGPADHPRPDPQADRRHRRP
jgi:hypothetical protein